MELHFDVSSGLKRIIGRDLITDDEVAIFELVKNAFDARATRVHVRFDGDTIYVADNGSGMSYEDIEHKWLFVAYSEKHDAHPPGSQYREAISERRHYAGSKGIGRFSADCLGSRLTLTTRHSSAPTGPVSRIEVDWSLFESNPQDKFWRIPVTYAQVNSFEAPNEILPTTHGTVIRIDQVRRPWSRERMLHLKASLAKLINPFGSSTDGFQIAMSSPAELPGDEHQRVLAQERGEPDSAARHLVNGEVGNFIFSTLQEKTTFIRVALEPGGTHLTSVLVDRGEEVYRIREPSPYLALRGSAFQCDLYYLNQSAKQTFARRMGIPSVQFGSIFLFRNGFRVFPVGEEGDDHFEIDRRKQQGYKRFLGTRDIIGRIEVSGSEEDFMEATSRDHGLVATQAVREMEECFREHCLKRLEKYVVPVTWVDSADKDSEDLSRLLTDSGRARVADVVAKLIDNPDVEVLAYSHRLISVLSERSSLFEGSLGSLRAIAEKTNDGNMIRVLERAERRFAELRTAEAEAVRVAAEERSAKETAQKQAVEAQATARHLQVKLTEEKKRALFLASISTLDTTTIIGMHHQITIYAADLQQQIENFIRVAESVDPDEIMRRLEGIAFLNQKVISIARLATKANFRLESDMIEADLVEYVDAYVREGAMPFLHLSITPRVVRNNAALQKRFKPMEVAIIVDNLISNSRKAGATEVTFTFSNPDKRTLQLDVTDNGRGLTGIDEPDRIFELGFTRTSGSGLGLYHVRQALDDLQGSITVDPSFQGGARFLVKVSA